MKRLAGRFSMFVLAAVMSMSGQQPTVPYDLLIRGARVLDGAGNPWVRADVAIRADRIVAVGRLTNAVARRTIEARDRYLAPGFIDMHSHSDFSLLVDGKAESKIRQGVTTEVLGEGGSAAPLSGPAQAAAGSELQALGLQRDWTDFNGYFNRLERQGISVNVLSFVGSGQIRAVAMGYDDKEPTSQDMDRMRALVRESMMQGTFGLASGLIYQPNSYLKTNHLIELAREAARFGGIYISHIRGEGDTLIDALREAITIGERGGLPVEIYHFKATGAMKGKILDAARFIEDARARGVDVTANQYPYIAGSTGLQASIPTWAHDGGRNKLIERLSDPKVRERIKGEMKTGSPGWFNLPKDAGSFENIWVTSLRTSGNKKYEGKSIAAIARDRGKGAEDTLMDLLVEEEGAVGAIYFVMSEEDVKAAMKLPWVSIGSDGSALNPEGVLGRGKPHPRSYGTHARVLSKYVRDEKVLTLEEAVRKMTSLPATRLGLADRGAIRAGMTADLSLFDLARVKENGAYEDPHRLAEGFDTVIVSGQVVIDEGRHTGAKPGRVIRGPGWVK